MAVRKYSTIGDVARAAGVSRQTVSRVINDKGEITDETRQRVRDVIERLGYRPHTQARNLAGGRARCIGLVITNPAEEVPTQPFFLGVIYGVTTEAQKHGYGLMIKYAAADEVIRLRERIFERGQVDGFVILRAHRDFAHPYGHGDLDQLPVLLIGDFPTGCQYPFLDLDNASGSRLLAEHLVDHGYHRVAIVVHSPDGHVTADVRMASLVDSFGARGVRIAREDIVRTNSTMPDTYAKTLGLARRSVTPEAIVATNDWTAMVVIRAIHDAGLRVPEDIAVVGFDDLPLAAYLEPPLTTAVFPSFDLGKEAFRRLIRHIEDGQPPASGHLPTRLVIRRSCGCPGSTPLGAKIGDTDDAIT